jgi:hypothetical protein
LAGFEVRATVAVRALTIGKFQARIGLFRWMGAYWFRPERYARGGMPRTVRWPR